MSFIVKDNSDFIIQNTFYFYLHSVCGSFASFLKIIFDALHENNRTVANNTRNSFETFIFLHIDYSSSFWHHAINFNSFVQ